LNGFRYSRLCYSLDLPHVSTLSLHDALPIWPGDLALLDDREAAYRVVLHVHHRDAVLGLAKLFHQAQQVGGVQRGRALQGQGRRSEEHTSELQSRENLVCRLLIEKKNNTDR